MEKRTLETLPITRTEFESANVSNLTSAQSLLKLTEDTGCQIVVRSKEEKYFLKIRASNSDDGNSCKNCKRVDDTIHKF